jgi:hypothetical protein
MKLRFSLRALFVLIAALAIFGYWRSRPAAIAREFERAIAVEDFAAADSLMATPASRDFQQWAANGGSVRVRLKFDSQSTWDWLRGQCRGSFRASARTAYDAYIVQSGQLLVTATGICKFDCKATARFGYF